MLYGFAVSGRESMQTHTDAYSTKAEVGNWPANKEGKGIVEDMNWVSNRLAHKVAASDYAKFDSLK